MTKPDVLELRTSKLTASSCSYQRILQSNAMAPTARYLASFTRGLTCPFQQSARPNFSPPSFLYPAQQQSRAAHQTAKARASKSDKSDKPVKTKRRKEFKQYDLKDAIQFSLCDAMRYVHAYAVCFPLLLFCGHRSDKLSQGACPPDTSEPSKPERT